MNLRYREDLDIKLMCQENLQERKYGLYDLKESYKVKLLNFHHSFEMNLFSIAWQFGLHLQMQGHFVDYCKQVQSLCQDEIWEYEEFWKLEFIQFQWSYLIIGIISLRQLKILIKQIQNFDFSWK